MCALMNPVTSQQASCGSDLRVLEFRVVWFLPQSNNVHVRGSLHAKHHLLYSHRQAFDSLLANQTAKTNKQTKKGGNLLVASYCATKCSYCFSCALKKLLNFETIWQIGTLLSPWGKNWSTSANICSDIFFLP